LSCTHLVCRLMAYSKRAKLSSRPISCKLQFDFIGSSGAEFMLRARIFRCCIQPILKDCPYLQVDPYFTH
jgi:hypothetical protein